MGTGDKGSHRHLATPGIAAPLLQHGHPARVPRVPPGWRNHGAAMFATSGFLTPRPGTRRAILVHPTPHPHPRTPRGSSHVSPRAQHHSMGAWSPHSSESPSFSLARLQPAPTVTHNGNSFTREPGFPSPLTAQTPPPEVSGFKDCARASAKRLHPLGPGRGGASRQRPLPLPTAPQRLPCRGSGVGAG